MITPQIIKFMDVFNCSGKIVSVTKQTMSFIWHDKRAFQLYQLRITILS